MELSTDMFFWNGKDKRFSQEISSLNLGSCGGFYMGFTLINPKTNGAEHFIFMDRKYHKGELSGWDFYNEKHGLTLTIWND